jgi:hypothetical protein
VEQEVLAILEIPEPLAIREVLAIPELLAMLAIRALGLEEGLLEDIG